MDDLRTLFPLRIDGRLFGCVARLGEILAVYDYIAGWFVSTSCGVAAGVFPVEPDFADDFHLLSHYVADDGLDKFYRHSGIAWKGSKRKNACAYRRKRWIKTDKKNNEKRLFPSGNSLISYVVKNLRSVSLFKTSRAYVAGHFLAVFNVGYLLNVCLEGSSRFTVGVADVVAARLTFTANIAYSGHINTSEF